MKPTRLLALLFGISTLTAACTAAVGDIQLEGLQALTGQESTERAAPASGSIQNETTQSQPLALAPEPLLELANQAEQAAPFLDIVQIELDLQNNLVVFAIFTLPAATDDTLGEAEFQKAVEAVWSAAANGAPEAQNISILFMRVLPVNTLDRGLAPSGWLIGGVVAPLEEVAGYLAGSPDDAARAEYWGSGSVVTTPLDQPYASIPNHPVRSLEA